MLLLEFVGTLLFGNAVAWGTKLLHVLVLRLYTNSAVVKNESLSRAIFLYEKSELRLD